MGRNGLCSPILRIALSKVLTLGKLRPKEEVVARVHWSQPGWKLEVPALSLAQGSVSCPRDFIPAQGPVRHTLHCSARTPALSLKYRQGGLGSLAAIAASLPHDATNLGHVGWTHGL